MTISALLQSRFTLRMALGLAATALVPAMTWAGGIPTTVIDEVIVAGQLEGGEGDHFRGLLAASPEVGSGTLLVGLSICRTP